MDARNLVAMTLSACLTAWTITLAAEKLPSPAPTVTAATAATALVVQGRACHGANVSNNESISDYANTQSFLPPDVFAFWNAFKMEEIGVVDNDPRRRTPKCSPWPHRSTV